jgi:tetratricopeptide (TPR) repeat protein
MHLALSAAFVLLTAAGPAPAASEQNRLLAVEHYERGRDLMSNERFEEAVAEFKAAIELEPLFTLAYFRKGQAHMTLKEYAQAEQAFLGCRQTHENLASLQLPKSEDFELSREEVIEQLKSEWNTQMAVRVSELRRNPPQERQRRAVPPELSVSLGSAYFRQGKMDLAEKEWKEATVANPKLGEAHNNLAALYLMSQRLDDAEKELELAEKAGYHVRPRLKDDIKNARKSSSAK